MPDDQLTTTPALRTRVLAALDEVGRVVRGNPAAVRLVGAALLARGHVLLEDVPGVGKTTLARAVARAFGCTFSRVQFTSDLLPSDVVGVQVLDPKDGSLRFQKGPIFAHLVLADEINRASPKTQSALLEAMADGQVTIDDQSHVLERPFSVIATQNPVEHHGTYPLPESQLDRFMVRTSLGYPPADDERRLLMSHRGTEPLLDEVRPQLDPATVRTLAETVEGLHLDESVASYLYELVQGTREHPEVSLGCSTRGALAWAALARAFAFLEGREYVLPDDIKHLAPAVLLHRLQLRGTSAAGGERLRAAAVVDELLARTPVPR
ncbi:MAG: AAA family ATPase [Myxococcota bacterium]